VGLVRLAVGPIALTLEGSSTFRRVCEVPGQANADVAGVSTFIRVGSVARVRRLEIHSLHDLGWYVRNGVHFGLFMGALAGQGSDEQRAEWLPKVRGVLTCHLTTGRGAV
jgi:alkylation response protein AidB-like acyl-CoA dehydrogenase